MPAAPIIAAVAAIASTGYAIYSGQKQQAAASDAADQAKATAEQQSKDAQAQAKAAQDQAAVAQQSLDQTVKQNQQQLAAADESTNSASQKSPNTSSAVDAAMQAGKAGASGTLLTGPQGIDPAALNLGKNTLLGQ